MLPMKRFINNWKQHCKSWAVMTNAKAITLQMPSSVSSLIQLKVYGDCLPQSRIHWKFLHFCWIISKIITQWSFWMSKSWPWVLTIASWLGPSTRNTVLGHFAQELLAKSASVGSFWARTVSDTWAAEKSSLLRGRWTQDSSPRPLFLLKPACSPSKDLESGSSPKVQQNSLGRDPDEGDISCFAARGCFNRPSCSHSFHSFHGLMI